MTGSTIFLCLGLRYRDLTSIWWRCLAPSLHNEWTFMANHIGAYTRMMYVTSVFRFSNGFLSLTYNRRILLAVVSHLELFRLPGFCIRPTRSTPHSPILMLLHISMRYR